MGGRVSGYTLIKSQFVIMPAPQSHLQHTAEKTQENVSHMGLRTSNVVVWSHFTGTLQRPCRSRDVSCELAPFCWRVLWQLAIQQACKGYKTN